MPLISALFADNEQLQACLVSNPAHLTPGTKGDHVSRIHSALLILDKVQVDPAEIKSKTYGPSTAAAVLAYKTKRAIINPAYQSKPDNIVGKMTIARMDAELAAIHQLPPVVVQKPTARANFT